MARLDPYHSKSTRMETESSLGKTFAENDGMYMYACRWYASMHKSVPLSELVISAFSKNSTVTFVRRTKSVPKKQSSSTFSCGFLNQ